MDKRSDVVVFSATEFELAGFKDWAKGRSLPVAVVVTGVGLLPASFAIAQHLLLHKPAFALQAGIAGLIGSQFSPETVFAIRQDRVADAGVLQAQQWQSLAAMNLEQPYAFPLKNGVLTNNHAAQHRLPDWPLADAFSVNQISHLPQLPHHPKTDGLPMLETMEGAAFHYACLATDTPFLQVRTVSNLVGERRKEYWQMKPAIHTLNNALIRWFSQGSAAQNFFL